MTLKKLGIYDDITNFDNDYLVIENAREAKLYLRRIHWKTVKALLDEITESREIIDSLSVSSLVTDSANI